MRFSPLLTSIGILLLAATGLALTPPADQPYSVLKSEKVGGAGGFDYVYADSDGRKLYIPRGNRVDAYDLDTLKAAGSIANTNGVHGAAVDTKSHHGFCSSRPVVMWDTETMKTIKTIDVQGGPDGILFEPAMEQVYILSHSQPNVTVIDAKDGSVVGTIDLGGQPEQGASDGNGHVYIDLEDKGTLAVVDAKTMKVTTHYDLGGKAGGLAGLAMDTKNHILFACGRNPATCTVVNAEDGKVLATLPTGAGVDAASFNPNTMEAFVSTGGDGTLTVIKENSLTDFVVEQTVKTKAGAKTHTLDTKTNQIYLITAERAAPATQPATQAAGAAPGGRRGGGRGGWAPDSFTILVVGKP